jgi:predicted nicotinamide N-methyase
MDPLPAHQTKDISPLVYPLTGAKAIHITQKSPLNSVSTGTTLYLSSQLLAHYVQETTPRGQRAVELGAGTGIVSIALGILGWQVWATDLSNVIDDVLRTNIERNREGTVIIQELDWCADSWQWEYPTPSTIPPEFDLILCADGIYALELIDPLLQTLKTLSGSRSPIILLALERRDTAVIDSFFQQSRSHGFTSKKINLRRVLGRQIARWGWTPDDWHSVEIWTMRYKPSSNESSSTTPSPHQDGPSPASLSPQRI